MANGKSKSNPRYSNGSLRRKHRARLKALGDPCGICGGRLGPIHYDEPSDAQHPLSFVVDEIRPVSKWRQYGYESPRAAAEDWNNLQAAHYICNQRKGNKTSPARDALTGYGDARGSGGEMKKIFIVPNESDGEW